MFIKTKVFLILIVISYGSDAKEPQTIFEMAKRNASGDQELSKPVKQDNYDYSQSSKVDNTDPVVDDPKLIKIISTHDKRKIAFVHYNNGLGRYAVGDFVPPHYRLKTIGNGSIVLSCERKSKCNVSQLGLTGL